MQLPTQPVSGNAAGSRPAPRPTSTRPPGSALSSTRTPSPTLGPVDAGAQPLTAAPSINITSRSHVIRQTLAAVPAALALLQGQRPAQAKSSVVSELLDPGSGRTIIKTASGIKYTDVEVGSGDAPQVGDLVMCDLVLRLEDERVVLDTREAGTPIAFQLGITNPLVPEGLEEVVRSMRAGTTRLAVVPAALGYGAKGAKPRGSNIPVPANSDLYYEVELLRCQGTPLGLACCSERKFGERGGACIPPEELEKLQSIMSLVPGGM